MTSYPTVQSIYTIWYNFDTVLYQFLETGTSDRCLICIVQNLRFSGFILYPLSFFLYSPFKNEECGSPNFENGTSLEITPTVPLLSNQYRITCTGEYSMMSPLSSLTTIMFMIQGPAALMVSFVFPSLAISSFVRLHVSRSFRAYITSNKITYNI